MMPMEVVMIVLCTPTMTGITGRICMIVTNSCREPCESCEFACELSFCKF